MSLSKNTPNKAECPQYTGKVIIGMNTPGPDEMTIQEIEGKRQLMWDDSTNDEYLNRVKEKAKEKAKEIIMLAELEAEALRATGQQDGYQEGLAKAQEDLNAHTKAMSAEVENILSQLGAQGKTIFDERRQDIMTLIKLAVEKTLKIEMQESRLASVEALMTEALERIESQRQLAIKCAPDDAADLEAFIATIQERNPALKYWTVKGDPTLQQGGILLESADGKVDNSVASRWKGVEPILDQLLSQVSTPAAENKG
ncbi:FliH/SctL family protein [Pseudodesulfovibrio piezophilus]|uniref:Flagellar assembly protein FliH n=1 Tax=Pseudodesulfovibrio piezophilus (strain DSM 21447 / JCM 15486 / C1TLV30) TaxID=1322246 RepID=M1WYG8_PSEP2|nr:FliH/SctL family protein [Pseudodesulfovibrio piezophilus]CCH50343.1 H+transporting two-sector ATPase E subunit [Pseudodesulfovibrio piezophilus C1TLV30]